MKKKIFLLFLSFVISHTSEIDIILSGLSEKKEKIFFKVKVFKVIVNIEVDIVTINHIYNKWGRK